jgi:hypothetical protein
MGETQLLAYQSNCLENLLLMNEMDLMSKDLLQLIKVHMSRNLKVCPLSLKNK